VAAVAAQARVSGTSSQPRRFRLRYAPHFGMFKAHAGDDVVSQLDFMAAEGFTALEDNGMKGRPVAEQERIARAMQRLGMQMGVFVAHTIDWREPSLTADDPALRERFLREIRESVDVAKRVGARWMTVVPGFVHPRLDLEFQTARLIDTLRRAADVLAPHGLVMVLEPLNTRQNHPGMILTGTAQGYMICRAVNSPACKVLYDMYHQQITEGNLIPNMDTAWSEIAYFQVGDNPGRNEPGTGDLPLERQIADLEGAGYRGWVGLEYKPGDRPSAEAFGWLPR
jgi:hydroxypyruvate isomerase